MGTPSPEDTGHNDIKTTDAAVSFASLRRLLTRWLTTAILVPVAVGILGVVVLNYWSRPRLSVSVAKAVVGAYRIQGSDGVREYRIVLDMLAPCVAWLSEYSAVGYDVIARSSRSTAPRLVYGVYLENVGRSQLTDIRIAFRSNRAEFDVAGSPQLSLTHTRQFDPGGNNMHVVAIASMAPGAKAAIIGVLADVDGRLSLQPNQAGLVQVDYRPGEVDRTPNANSHVRVFGSAQLGDIPLTASSINEFFVRQKEAYGLTTIYLPIDPIELTAQGGQFGMRLLNAPFMGCTECPVKAPQESYTASVLQWGATDTVTPTLRNSVVDIPPTR